jgi:hypothetical protein
VRLPLPPPRLHPLLSLALRLRRPPPLLQLPLPPAARSTLLQSWESAAIALGKPPAAQQLGAAAAASGSAAAPVAASAATAPPPPQQLDFVKRLFAGVKQKNGAPLDFAPDADTIGIDDAGNIMWLGLGSARGRLDDDLLKQLCTVLPALKQISFSNCDLAGTLHLNDLPRVTDLWLTPGNAQLRVIGDLTAANDWVSSISDERVNEDDVYGLRHVNVSLDNNFGWAIDGQQFVRIARSLKTKLNARDDGHAVAQAMLRTRMLAADIEQQFQMFEALQQQQDEYAVETLTLRVQNFLDGMEGAFQLAYASKQSLLDLSAQHVAFTEQARRERDGLAGDKAALEQRLAAADAALEQARRERDAAAATAAQDMREMHLRLSAAMAAATAKPSQQDTLVTVHIAALDVLEHELHLVQRKLRISEVGREQLRKLLADRRKLDKCLVTPASLTLVLALLAEEACVRDAIADVLLAEQADGVAALQEQFRREEPADSAAAAALRDTIAAKEAEVAAQAAEIQRLRDMLSGRGRAGTNTEVATEARPRSSARRDGNSTASVKKPREDSNSEDITDDFSGSQRTPSHNSPSNVPRIDISGGAAAAAASADANATPRPTPPTQRGQQQHNDPGNNLRMDQSPRVVSSRSGGSGERVVSSRSSGSGERDYDLVDE